MDIINVVKDSLINRGIELIAALPNVIGGIILLIILWLIAKLISNTLNKLLIAIKIDDLEKQVKQISLFSNLSFKISAIASKSVFWLIMTIVTLETTRAIGLNSIADGIAGFIAYIPILVSSFMFFLVGVFIANIIKGVIEAACISMNITAGKIISGFVFYFLLIMVAITAINQTGIETDILTQNVTILIGSIFFAIALGYAIASKDLMANMLGSFYSKGKFMVGQTIKVEEIEGKIIGMDSTSAILESGNKKIVMPLAKLANTTVEIL